MELDFGRTAADYGRHRAGFPDSLFERLAPFGIGRPGQALVDLGTGAGTLARGFARRGCRVVGIDRSPALLSVAADLDREAGVSVAYREARAEATGLEPASADVVSAGQCWHWFERGAAAAEVARILRRPGRLVIAHFDWLPLAGNAVEATEELISTHNRQWRLGGGLGLHPRWLRELAEAGYGELETFSYDVDVPYTHEGWRGRIRASAGVGASLPEPQVAAFDRAHEALLRERFPEEPLAIPHRVFALLARPPERAADGRAGVAA